MIHHYSKYFFLSAQPTITSGDVTENHHVTYTCDGQFGGPPKDVISPGHYPKMQIFLDDTLVENKGNIKELGPKNGNNAHTLQKVNVCWSPNMHMSKTQISLKKHQQIIVVRDFDISPMLFQFPHSQF